MTNHSAARFCLRGEEHDETDSNGYSETDKQQ